MVVASGRDTISVSSSIKRLAPENVFVVQVKVYYYFILFYLSLIAFDNFIVLHDIDIET